MNGTRDTSQAGTAGEGGGLDPRQAAKLLEQTRLQARRQLEPYPPWLLVIRAFIALAIYGTIWLSVRGQHPYHYPTAAVIPVVVVLAVVNFVATVAVAKRATAGVSGRSRLRPADIAAWVAVWVGVFAGPAGAWAVAGVGLCVVLLGTAAAIAWRQHA